MIFLFTPLGTQKDFYFSEHLKEEHKDDTTSVEIHERLSKAKKTQTESYVEFMYSVKKMGRDKIDERSLIKYVVNGLPDRAHDKITLFEALTFDELKKKLKVFESSAATRNTAHNTKNGAPKPTHHKKQNKNGQENKKQSKCYNCGNEGHNRDACPDKDRGKKCFNCAAFGHVGKDCRLPKKLTNGSNSKNTVAMIDDLSENTMMLAIKVNKRKIEAVLDTGCPYTMIDETFYKQCGTGKLTNHTVPLNGFAGRMERSLGSTNLDVAIDGELYELKGHVVKDGLMPYRMLLGRNLLAVADVAIVRGVPIITRQDNQIAEIMMIQPTPPAEIGDLQCIQNIEDKRYKDEVIELITNYNRSCIQMELELVDKVPVYQHPRRLWYPISHNII